MLLRAVVLLLRPLMAWQTAVQALGGKTLMGTAPTCVYLEGARVVNDAGEHFGKMANPFDSESIFNKFGTLGFPVGLFGTHLVLENGSRVIFLGIGFRRAF